MRLRAILAAGLILLAASYASASERGVASWYGPREHGRVMANGQRFNQWAHTAAHRTLPFGTQLQIRNPVNDRTCNVVVTDRGPYKRGRTIDLSRQVARILNVEERGLAIVEIKVLSIPARPKRT